MLTIDTAFFLYIPGESKERILHPARIVGCVQGLCTAELEEADLPIAEDQETLVFYEHNHNFVQQTACITQISDNGPKVIVGLKTTGEPVSAECRQNYRVSAVLAELTAELGKERECPLLDVSSTGFSVIAGDTHQIGSIVGAVLRYDGKEYRGEVCVQSIQDLGEGRIRYGLHCVENNKQSSLDMSAGLQNMNLALQREQLRRLAGTR